MYTAHFTATAAVSRTRLSLPPPCHRQPYHTKQSTALTKDVTGTRSANVVDSCSTLICLYANRGNIVRLDRPHKHCHDKRSLSQLLLASHGALGINIELLFVDPVTLEVTPCNPPATATPLHTYPTAKPNTPQHTTPMPPPTHLAAQRKNPRPAPQPPTPLHLSSFTQPRPRPATTTVNALPQPAASHRCGWTKDIAVWRWHCLPGHLSKRPARHPLRIRQIQLFFSCLWDVRAHSSVLRLAYGD